MNFGVNKLWKKIETSWVYVNLILHLFEHVLCQFSGYELIDFFDDDMMFTLLNLLMMYEPCVFVKILVC
jgi:hypothetical protein